MEGTIISGGYKFRLCCLLMCGLLIIDVVMDDGKKASHLMAHTNNCKDIMTNARRNMFLDEMILRGRWEKNKLYGKRYEVVTVI